VKQQATEMAKDNPREEGFFLALADMKLAGFDDQIAAAIASDNDTLIAAAENARKVIAAVSASEGKRVAGMDTKDVLKAAMESTGDPGRGRELFTRQGCVACHAVEQAAVQKGPYLGSAGSKFTRDYLIMSILDPNAVVAQGFQTELITLKNGMVHMGFVTREEDGVIEIRNVAGIASELKEADVKSRVSQPMSMMPPGLAGALSVGEFVDLVEYLASMKE
jgi:putative heme-binding domain-containing protein